MFHRLLIGKPETYLPLMDYILMKWNLFLAKWVVSLGYQLQSKNDLEFVKSVFQLAATEFNKRIKLSSFQFLSNGFAERKMHFLCDLIQLCKSKAEALEKEAMPKKKSISQKKILQMSQAKPKPPSPPKIIREPKSDKVRVEEVVIEDAEYKPPSSDNIVYKSKDTIVIEDVSITTKSQREQSLNLQVKRLTRLLEEEKEKSQKAQETIEELQNTIASVKEDTIEQMKREIIEPLRERIEKLETQLATSSLERSPLKFYGSKSPEKPQVKFDTSNSEKLFSKVYKSELVKTPSLTSDPIFDRISNKVEDVITDDYSPLQFNNSFKLHLNSNSSNSSPKQTKNTNILTPTNDTDDFIQRVTKNLENARSVLNSKPAKII